MKFWQQLLSKLKENKKVYLLTVIQNSGSSPGRKGFKMMVAEDGFIYGSVGGGVMEFTLVEEVKILLQNNDLSIFLKKQIHQGNSKDSSGMICSGEQTVVFHPLDTTNISLIKNILNQLKKGNKGILELTSNSINFFENRMRYKFEVSILSEENWNFKEQIGFKETLYIIGGGHVGWSLSELMVKLNFNVVVLDNRNNLNTLENNQFAHKTLVVQYNEITNYIPEGKDTYIAIMTNKYTDDKLVLSQLMRKNYKYIGVLGSKFKLKTMWNILLKEGVSQDDLDSVYAPIGLYIKSETTNEIAISIAAEIIEVKNKTE